MVTVKQFKESCFKIDDLDACREVKTLISYPYEDISPTCSDAFLVITDLAWRKNTGVQPVSDDCWVEVELSNLTSITNTACTLLWDISDSASSITKWKPSLKHLEQQMNDNQETKTALEMSERDIENYADDCDVERELKESDEAAWESGDIAIHEGHEVLVIDWHPHHPLLVVEGGNGFFATSSDKLSKPETPEKKVARERMESAYDLYLESKESMEPCMSKTTFIHTDNKEKELWLRIIDKTGYRKQ